MVMHTVFLCVSLYLCDNDVFSKRSSKTDYHWPADEHIVSREREPKVRRGIFRKGNTQSWYKTSLWSERTSYWLWNALKLMLFFYEDMMWHECLNCLLSSLHGQVSHSLGCTKDATAPISHQSNMATNTRLLMSDTRSQTDLYTAWNSHCTGRKSVLSAVFIWAGRCVSSHESSV